jgi:Ca2+-binding EF-hand superfamily protein
LTKDELKVLLSGLGKDVDVGSFLNSVDINNDGKLDFNEFISAASAGHFDKKLTKEQIAKLEEQFSAADVNKDGFLSKDELKTLLASLGNEIDVSVFLNSVDVNNDGKLDFNEFVIAASAGHFSKKLTKE